MNSTLWQTLLQHTKIFCVTKSKEKNKNQKKNKEPKKQKKKTKKNHGGAVLGKTWVVFFVFWFFGLSLLALKKRKLMSR